MGSPLTRWLEIDREAAKEIEGHDPHFAQELKSLQQELKDARTALAALLEEENASNESISGQIEFCIAKHNALERRVSQYLLNCTRSPHT